MEYKFIVLKLMSEENREINFKDIKSDIREIVKLLNLNYKIEVFSEGVSNFSSRIQKILDFLYKNYFRELTLTQAAGQLGLSKYYFERIFSHEIGISFKRFLNIFRLYKAAEILRSNNFISITNVCFDVGFNDLSNFINQFKKTFGCSPKKFMNCCADPEKCILRKNSILFNIFKSNNKLNESLGFPGKYACYIKRQ